MSRTDTSSEEVLAYTWTPDNHVKSIQGYRRSAVTPDGAIPTNASADVILQYGWDYLGRLSSSTNPAGPGYPTSYQYDNAGNLAEVRYPYDILDHFYSYNAQNRLTNMWVTNVGGLNRQYRYALDATGNRTNAVETDYGSLYRSVRYEYDGGYGGEAPPARVHRLTRETMTNSSGGWAGAITNTYDPVGNRLSRQVGLGFTPVDSLTNQSFAFDHRDLIDSDNVPNNANPNYDANGNTLVDNGAPTGDLYDAENRLIARGTTIQIGYDDQGNRVSETVNGVTTYYLVDDQNPSGYAQVLAEYDSLSNAPGRAYEYGLSLISETAGGDEDYLYFGYDGQGNVRQLVDELVELEDTYDYDAFGNLLASTGSDSNNYRYTGQQWDPNLGMYYNRARYYKPGLGRFWTMDTYQGDNQDPLSLHKYLYCQANPVNHIDPSGHDLGDVLVTMSIGATIGGLSSAVANVAEGRAITAQSVFEGAALGAVLGPLAGSIPAVGVGLGVGGAVYSGLSYGPILFDPNASIQQREASAVLIFSSIYGAAAGMKYGEISENGTVNNCFVAGTLVLENDGYKPIEAVKVGDLVWSWDQEQNDLVLEPVQRLFQRSVEKLVVLNFGTNVVETTPGHRFWVEGAGWLEASNLCSGEALTTFDKGTEILTSVADESAPTTVFNFEVKDTHTYFVTGDAVLVHNACAKDLAGNLEAVGESRPPGTDAHHIVARNDARAAQARAILQREKIDLDDAANGAFLDSSAHDGLHTDLYYETLCHELEGALPGTVRARLLVIGQELKAGVYPH